MNPDGYYGKACKPGYQSHYILGMFFFFFFYFFLVFLFLFYEIISKKKKKKNQIVGPRDKKNQENTGPFPIETEYDKERDANELVVFESAQATPLFIVFTDPDMKQNTPLDQKQQQNPTRNEINFFDVKGLLF